MKLLVETILVVAVVICGTRVPGQVSGEASPVFDRARRVLEAAAKLRIALDVDGTATVGRGVLREWSRRPLANLAQAGDEGIAVLAADRARGDSLQEKEAPVPSVLVQMIRSMDRGFSDRDSPGGKAFRELRGLGSLVRPALIRQIDSVGPVGLAAILKLLRMMGREAPAEAVEHLLASPDIARQRAGAQELSRLPESLGVELARRALKIQTPEVRVAALEVLARAGVDREIVIQEIRTLLERGPAYLRARLARILGESSLGAPEVTDAWLERLLEDESEDVRGSAFLAWCATRGPGEGQSIARRFSALRPKELQAWVLDTLAREIREENLPPWDEVVGLILNRRDAEKNLRFLDFLETRNLDLSTGNLQTALLAFSPPYVPSLMRVRQWVLDRILQSNDPGLAPFFWKVLLDQRFERDRERILSWLIRHDPKGAVAGINAMMEGGIFIREGLEWLIRHGDVRSARLALRILARGGEPKGRLNALLLKVAVAGSDASCLADALALVEAPLLFSYWIEAVRSFKLMIHRWLGASEVPIVLEKIETLDAEAAAGALKRIMQVVTPSQIPLLAEVIRRQLPRARKEPAVAEGETPSPAAPSARRGESPVQAGYVIASLMQTLADLKTRESDEVLFSLITSDLGWVRRFAFQKLAWRASFDQRRLAKLCLAPGNEHLKPMLKMIIDQPEIVAVEELRKGVLGFLAERRTVLSESQVLTFLRRVSEKEVRAFARGVLADPDPKRRGDEVLQRALLKHLGDLKTDEVIPELALGLGHPSSDVRLTAVIQIARTSSRKAVPVLLEAMKDDVPKVRTAAREGLSRIHDYLEEVKRWREAGILDG